MALRARDALPLTTFFRDYQKITATSGSRRVPIHTTLPIPQWPSTPLTSAARVASSPFISYLGRHIAGRVLARTHGLEATAVVSS